MPLLPQNGLPLTAKRTGDDEHPTRRRDIGDALIYVIDGTAAVTVEGAVRVVSSGEALWVAGGTSSGLQASRCSRSITIVLRASRDARSTPGSRTIRVTPFLHELIVRFATSDTGTRPTFDSLASLETLLLDEVAAAECIERTDLLPASPALQALCRAFVDDLGSTASAHDWGARFGMTRKTLGRRFREEFDMTFGAWQRAVRVAEAKRRLRAGQSVTHVAGDLGYDNLSAFAAMFRRSTGSAPSAIFASDEDATRAKRNARAIPAAEKTYVIKDIAFTAYPAADVAKLRAFYVDTLGIALSEPMSGDDGAAAYCEAQVGSGYFALLLDALLERPKGSGAGVVFEIDDLESMTAHLRARGIEVSDKMEFPRCVLANFTDPEGNKVSLHQTLSHEA